MGRLIYLGMVIGIVLLCAVGYIQNVIHLFELSPFVFDAKSIIGIGGVFVPPIGIIMGLFVW